jgi:peptidoglycan/xylan/chitin deacetylase (PgdA/CDA1 family)
MNQEQKPSPPQRDRHDPKYRRIMVLFTGLLIAGLITAALWPTGGPRQELVHKEPSSLPDKAPTPVPPKKEAQPEPPQPEKVTPPEVNPPPKRPDPLPTRPAGEPSLLVSNGSRSCAKIALTYDAGSGADGASAILDTLKKHGVTATFFLTGKWVERYPDLAKRIASEGHEIANHTYSHPDLTKLSDDEVIAEIRKGEEAIKKVTGRETRPLFREPYGAFNENQRRLVRQAGYSYSIYWDNDTLDWQFPGVPTEVSRITTKSRNGSIVLMHLNVPDTATASDQAIPILRQSGFQLVTVSELLQCK